jgi:hypothetical protein
MTGASTEPPLGLEFPVLPPVEGSDPCPDEPPEPDAESRLPSGGEPASGCSTYWFGFAHALSTRHATTGYMASRKRDFTILIMVFPPVSAKTIAGVRSSAPNGCL